jgi:hypothetical protein
MSPSQKIFVSSLKAYLSRPSSTHTDPSCLVKWEGTVPTLFRDKAKELVENDDFLLSLYDEIVRREDENFRDYIASLPHFE